MQQRLLMTSTTLPMSRNSQLPMAIVIGHQADDRVLRQSQVAVVLTRLTPQHLPGTDCCFWCGADVITTQSGDYNFSVDAGAGADGITTVGAQPPC